MKTPQFYTVDAPKMDAAKAAVATLAKSEGSGVAFEPLSALMSGIGDGNAVVDIAKVAIYLVVRGLVLPGELLFRRKFGERYFSPLVLGASFALIVLARYESFIYIKVSWILAIFIAAGIGIHTTILRLAQRKGIHWHSYSEGESWLQIPFLSARHRSKYGPFSTIDVAKNFLEPAAFFIAYLYFHPVNQYSVFREHPFVAVFANDYAAPCLVFSVTMFGYQYYCSRVRRWQLLDYLDAQIMMDAYQESQRAEPTQGLRRHLGIAYLPAQNPRGWRKQSTPAETAPTAPEVSQIV